MGEQGCENEQGHTVEITSLIELHSGPHSIKTLMPADHWDQDLWVFAGLWVGMFGKFPM